MRTREQRQAPRHGLCRPSGFKQLNPRLSWPWGLLDFLLNMRSLAERRQDRRCRSEDVGLGLVSSRSPVGGLDGGMRQRTEVKTSYPALRGVFCSRLWHSFNQSVIRLLFSRPLGLLSVTVAAPPPPPLLPTSSPLPVLVSAAAAALAGYFNRISLLWLSAERVAGE